MVKFEGKIGTLYQIYLSAIDTIVTGIVVVVAVEVVVVECQ